MSEKRLMRLPEVCRTCGLSRSEIYRLMSLRRFPRSVLLGQRVVAWPSNLVQAWIEEKIAAREAA